MTPNQVGLLALVPLAVLLLACARQDVKQHRIPNVLVFWGAGLGIVLNGLLPAGLGFNSALPGGVGWIGALQGLGVGLGIFLPLYLLRALGAGDVKLMAMVGSFLGPSSVLGAILGTLVAGGVLALLLTARARLIGRLMENLKLMLLGGVVNASLGKMPVVDGAPDSVGKMPYAVAITVGTLGWLIWDRTVI